MDKMKSGALLWVVAVSVIVMAMMTALLLMHQYSRQQVSQLVRADRLETHVVSALRLMLAGELIPVGRVVTRSLFGDAPGRDSVTVEKRNWGVYRVGLASAYEKGDTLRRIALVGTAVRSDHRTALYLADENRPVSVSGTTLIRGDAFLPPAGVRKAYIEGYAYEGADNPVEGTVRYSGTTLPPLLQTMTGQLAAWLQLPPDSLPRGRLPLTGDTLRHSFSLPTLLLESADSVYIANGAGIVGNVLLYSSYPVTVAAGACLEDILIMAPEIRIEDGFTGQLQAIARDSVIVGRHCRLRYPSAVGVLHTDTAEVSQATQPRLVIDSASRVDGLAFASAPGRREYLPVISIAAGSGVTGEVYADGLLQLRGSVSGSTWCRRFILQTPSTLYENFILHATLDATARSNHFAGSPLLDSTVRGRVAKWLK